MNSDKIEQFWIEIFRRHNKEQEFLTLKKQFEIKNISKSDFDLSVNKLIDSIDFDAIDSQKVANFFDNHLNDFVEDQSSLIVGNGGVTSLEEANQKVQETGVDGVMMGTGIFENPFLFNSDYYRDDNGRIFNRKNNLEFDLQQRLGLLLEHTLLWKNTWQNNERNFASLKKYVKIYISGIDEVSKIRQQIMLLQNIDELINFLVNELNKLKN
jgi:Dihydrouridine synthase (Dus)